MVHISTYKVLPVAMVILFISSGPSTSWSLNKCQLTCVCAFVIIARISCNPEPTEWSLENSSPRDQALVIRRLLLPQSEDTVAMKCG